MKTHAHPVDAAAAADAAACSERVMQAIHAANGAEAGSVLGKRARSIDDGEGEEGEGEEADGDHGLVYSGKAAGGKGAGKTDPRAKRPKTTAQPKSTELVDTEDELQDEPVVQPVVQPLAEPIEEPVAGVERVVRAASATRTC